MTNHSASDTWFRTDSSIATRRHPSGYRPSIRKLLTPILESIARLLWINRLSLTEQDRAWFKERLDQIFDARLRK